MAAPPRAWGSPRRGKSVSLEELLSRTTAPRQKFIVGNRGRRFHRRCLEESSPAGCNPPRSLSAR
ncbi:MAG: hypothetical protein AB7O62_13320 [Pirellulales bacterium]